MQEAHVAKREKEDALYRLEQVSQITLKVKAQPANMSLPTQTFFIVQMRAENEEMRKSLQEAVRLKSDYEHLKQVQNRRAPFAVHIFLNLTLISDFIIQSYAGL